MVERADVSSPEPAAPAQPPVPQGTVTTSKPRTLPDGRQVSRTLTQIEEAPDQPAAPAQRPAWLPEKFKSPEELGRAYSELERRLGAIGGGQQPAPQQPAASQPAPTDAVPEQPASSLMDRMTAEYAQTGKIGPELRQAFTKAYPGLPESVIDNHVAYLKHREQVVVQTATQRLGGPEAVRELNEWAKTRLSDAERQAFNRSIASDDDAVVAMAIDALNARYEADVGRPPRVIAGRKPNPNHGGLVAFQSSEEWLAAMKDPRYSKDPAFRSQVEDRLRMAQRAGLIE